MPDRIEQAKRALRADLRERRQTVSAHAREVAEAMLKNAPIAVSLVKEAVRRGMDTTLEGGLEIEADLFGMTVATKDFREGVDAFLNKRPAEFQGE